MLTDSSTGDSIIGTANNDSITGTNATYQDADLIIDSSTTDNDILTLNTTANISATPTVNGIERIVVNAEKVGTFTFDAQDISSANSITVNRLDLMDGAINGAGAVTINNAKATNFVAGDKVTAFTVDMDATSNIATAATIDATNATGTVTVTDIGYAGTTITGLVDQDFSVTGTTANATVNASGEVGATNAVQKLTVNATDTLELTLDTIGTAATPTSDELILSGDADITVKIAAAEITTETVTNNATGAVTIELTSVAGAAIDLSEVDNVTTVVAGATLAATDIITVADAQNISSGAQITGIALLADDENYSASLSVIDNEDADTAVTWAALTIGDASTNDGLDGVFDSATIDATNDDLIITTLDAGGNDTGGGNAADADGANIVLTGTKDITIGATGASYLVNAASLTSATTGDVTVISSGNNGGEQLIATLAGDDTIEVEDVNTQFVVNTGAGDDKVTVTAAKAESQIVTGAGEDEVNLDGATAVVVATGDDNDTVTVTGVAAHKINLGTGDNTIDFTDEDYSATAAEITLGTGANTLVSTSADLTGATITGNVDTVEITTSLAITSEQFNEFNGFSFASGSAGTLTIDATAATEAQIIDASAITLGYGVTTATAIDGSDFGDTITGTIGADTINLGAAGKTDTVIIADGDSGITAATADTIDTFTTTEDKLSLGLAGDATATTGNYVEAAEGDAADAFADWLGDANTALAALAGTSKKGCQALFYAKT